MSNTRHNSLTDRVLQPAPRRVVYGTLAAGFLFGMLPWPAGVPLPDVLAAVLVFWCIQAPSAIRLSLAFVMGILVDVHTGSLLGLHALLYCFLAYAVSVLYRRLSGFEFLGQAVHVAGIFAAAAAVEILARAFGGQGLYPELPLIEAVLQMLVWLLLRPVLYRMATRSRARRRAPDASDPFRFH